MTTIGYASSLNKFCDYLASCTKKNLTMVIGYRIDNPVDTKRKLKFDIGMDNYDSNELQKFFESTPSELIPFFVFNMDFNWFCVLSKGIVTKYNNINKLRTIVFDSSTFKFLSNVKLIALFYYLILEEGGSIYIESSSPICTGFIISSKQELLNTIARNEKNGFHCQTGYILPKSIENLLDTASLELTEANITTREKIYLQNVEFLTRWFYGSSVELLDNLDNSYPLVNERYPITKYYKITKELTHTEILNYISYNSKEYDTGLSLRTTTILRM